MQFTKHWYGSVKIEFKAVEIFKDPAMSLIGAFFVIELDLASV